MEYLHSESQIYANSLIATIKMKNNNKANDRIIESISKGKEIALRIIFIAILALGVVIIGRPLYLLIKISSEIRVLSQEKARYEESIRRDSALINNLKNDAFLEQYARENYFMHAPNEDVYIVE